MQLKVGQIWKHYKEDHLYKIIALPKHSDTYENMVVYEAQYEPTDTDNKLWVKETAEFLKEIEWQGKRVPRFELISDN